MNINENIFREYDIRGIYGTDITPEISEIIGKSFGTYIKNEGENKVIIGYDNRISSPTIYENLSKGILSTGINIIELGLVTTPMYYYAKKKQEIKSGIMITASHNPKEYNGFKMSFDMIGNAYGEAIQKFKEFTLKQEFFESPTPGLITKFDIREDYIKLLTDDLDLGFRKVKVVFDCGNGTGSIIVKDILDKLNITYYPLFCESDPEFPNHHPDPSVPANLIQLGEKVRELNYTVGIAVDGDADRVGIVDQDGKPIQADLIMDIFYRNLKSEFEENKAIYDVKCSKALIDDLEAMGYTTTMYRTGNSYLNAKINQDDYKFGGEFSGHLWFRDRFPGFDDGIYAGLRLIEILTNTDKTVSLLLDGLVNYVSTEEIKVPCEDSKKESIVEKIKAYAESLNYEINDIDGVRISFLDGWALVRASNTSPNLTLRFEARTEDRLSAIKNEFQSAVETLIRYN